MSNYKESYELQGQDEFYDNLNNQESMSTKETWTTDELQQDYKVIGFAFGYCAVERKSDGQRGSLSFRDRPREYYDFVAE
jgi:hypothetical protein